jgi:hypothetical protein
MSLASKKASVWTTRISPRIMSEPPCRRGAAPPTVGRSETGQRRGGPSPLSRDTTRIQLGIDVGDGSAFSAFEVRGNTSQSAMVGVNNE